MDLLRNDEIELLRTGEIADTRVRHIGGLVSSHHIVPYTHLHFQISPSLSLRVCVLLEGNERALAAPALSSVLLFRLRFWPFSLFSNLLAG
jgi:hypothetical protein